MSSNKASSDLLATNPPATASNGTTSLGHNNASQKSSPASKPKSQKGNSYMLDAWSKESTSSEPWSSLQATYSPRS